MFAISDNKPEREQRLVSINYWIMIKLMCIGQYESFQNKVREVQTTDDQSLLQISIRIFGNFSKTVTY